MFKRNIVPLLNDAFSLRPVVFLAGARQTGKSTLVKDLGRSQNIPYTTLDDLVISTAAKKDPPGFVESCGVPVAIDEVQRVPELLLAIKQQVDEARYAADGFVASLYVLTGSANIWTALRVAESLTGRVQRLALWPLSQGEIAGVVDTFVDQLFTGEIMKLSPAKLERSGVVKALLQGGFPEVLGLPVSARATWFNNYLRTTVERDIRDLADIQELSEVPALLKLLAARVGGLLNTTKLADDLQISRKTVARYMTLLEAIYLVVRIPAWRSNPRHRIIKSPKAWLVDSGLAAHLLAFKSERWTEHLQVIGALFENFVGMELMKQLTWSTIHAELYHFRTTGGREVDVVLEADDGRVCGVEVKFTNTVRSDDFRSLTFLRDELGEKFVAGVVIYTGHQVVPFGKRLWAVPVTALWS